MTTDPTPMPFPPGLVRAFRDIAAALNRMAEGFAEAMTQVGPRVAAFTACLPRVAYRVERPVDRARRLRVECWMRRRDRRAARRARR